MFENDGPQELTDFAVAKEEVDAKIYRQRLQKWKILLDLFDVPRCKKTELWSRISVLWAENDINNNIQAMKGGL